MVEQKRDAQPAGIDLGEIVRVVRRRKWWLIVPAVLLSTVAVLVAMSLPPVYRAEGTILIEGPNVPDDLVQSTVTSYADERVEKIRREFIVSDNIERIVQENGLYPELRGPEKMAQAIQKVRENLSVDLIQRSRRDPAVAFQVAFEYGDPAKAQSVAAELADWYLNQNVQTRQEKSRETAQFLEQQTAALSQEMQRLGEELSTFKKEHAGRLPNQSDLNQAELAELQRTLRDLDFEAQTLRERRADLSGLLSAIRNGTEPAAVAPDDRLQALLDERATLASRYTDRHPDIVRLDREIAALRERRSGSASDASGTAGAAPAADPQVFALKEQIAGVERQIKAVQRRRAGLDDEIAKLQADLKHAATIEDEYNGLQREYDNAVTDYRTLRRKQLTADMGASLELNQKGERFVLVEPPQQPLSPVRPNRKMIALGGIVASIGFGCALVVGTAMLDRTVSGARKLESLTGQPPLVVIPYIRTRAEVARTWFWRAGSAAAVAAALLYVHTAVMPLDGMARTAEQQVTAKLDQYLK